MKTWKTSILQGTIKKSGEFPGSLVLIALCFHCSGLGSVPVPGTKALHAMWCGQKKKEEGRRKMAEAVHLTHVNKPMIP